MCLQSPTAQEKGCVQVEVVNVPEDIGVILAAVVRSNTLSRERTFGLDGMENDDCVLTFDV